jgi:hypothetical protein
MLETASGTQRERSITRAEIMHALNDPREYGVFPIDFGSMLSGDITGMISDPRALSESMSNWADDVLDSFQIDRFRWPEQVVSPLRIQELLNEHTSQDTQNLAKFVIAETERQLYAAVSDGYANYAGQLTLRLSDTVNLDMRSEGQIWTDQSGYDYEMHFWSEFRKVH